MSLIDGKWLPSKLRDLISTSGSSSATPDADSVDTEKPTENGQTQPDSRGPKEQSRSNGGANAQTKKKEKQLSNEKKQNISRDDLIELVDKLLDGVRDHRYRELISDFKSDFSVEKRINELRNSENEYVNPDRSGR